MDSRKGMSRDDLKAWVVILVIGLIFVLLHFLTPPPCKGQQGDDGACTYDQRAEQL